jgi:molecular chaperone GrpE (heat shock protein)
LFSFFIYHPCVFQVPLQSSASNSEQETEEVRQLRENFAVLTSQYAQLTEANRAWQEFHQSQLDNFRRKVQECVQISDDFSFDQLAQDIVDQILKERDDFAQLYQALEKANNDLQSGNFFYLVVFSHHSINYIIRINSRESRIG